MNCVDHDGDDDDGEVIVCFSEDDFEGASPQVDQ